MKPDSGARRVALLIAPLLGSLGLISHAQEPKCPSRNDWPASMRLEYDVTASRGPLSINGESVLVFERIGARYTLDVTTSSAAIYRASQSSRGTVEKEGLRPVEFVETRGVRAPQRTTFDWDTKRVTFSAAPDAPGATQPGLQDRASLLLQLTWQQRASAGPSYEVPVAGTRRVTPHRFVPLGIETVKVPVGRIEALRVERAADAEQDRIEAWFGTGWCGLPLLIRYTNRNGGVIEHRMRAARIQ